MSLVRQLWLAVILITVSAFLGSFLVSTLSARNYLEQELHRKNLDNASSLALSISQQSKDPVTVELQVSALFDSGHYESISIISPTGQVLAERVQDRIETTVPDWFVNLIPLESKPGRAQVSDGWKQFGTVTIISHARFAHQGLWEQSKTLVLWFIFGALSSGGIGMLVLRSINKPLQAVVGQAHAISERRFLTINEPRTPELRSVVHAMNDMVGRIKQMFADEAARLDALRMQLNHDSVSSLSNREYFMGRLREALSGEDSAAYGSLLLLRLTDLAEINRMLGHAGTDKLIRDLGNTLQTTSSRHDKWLPARLNGPDFTVLAQDHTEAITLAQTVAQDLTLMLQKHWPELTDLFHIGALRYQRGDSLSSILSGADQILAEAESKGPNTWAARDMGTENQPGLSAEAWKKAVSDALQQGRIKLVHYPVMGKGGIALHQEGVIRLQTEANGPWLPAGDFMPMAVRLNLTTPIDLGVIRLALEELRSHNGNVAINLTAETISDWSFRNQLTGLIQGCPDLCRRLWVEVPEYGAFKHFDAFHELTRALKGMGVKVGIEHFGRKLSEVDKLADLGIDYVKVDTSFVQGIDQNLGNQEFLKGLCRMAHAIGIVVIAVGVQTQNEQETLTQLGFDGATGPGITS